MVPSCTSGHVLLLLWQGRFHVSGQLGLAWNCRAVPVLRTSTLECCVWEFPCREPAVDRRLGCALRLSLAGLAAGQAGWLGCR